MQIIDLVNDLRPTILAARQMRDARNTLASIFPYRSSQSVSYRVARRKRGDQVAPVRAIDAPSTPIRRPGLLDVKGDLPAITPRVDLSEQDLTDEMRIAQNLAGVPTDWASVVQSAAATAALTVDNTFEQLRGQLATTLGIVLTAEDGNTYSIDFGAQPGQIFEVTNPWNGEDGDPFADFEAVHNDYIDLSGHAAGLVLTTARVKRALLSALQVKFPNSPVDVSALNSYLNANELPSIATNDRTFTDLEGNRTRVYAEGHMTFLPGDGDPIGRTELGVTQEAVQQTQRIQPGSGRAALTAAEAPGITIVTLGQDDPVQRAVKAAAIGMPVLHEPDQVMVINGIFG